MIIKRYRKDYLGEFVLTETRWQGGVKQQNREWIPNPIHNQHISGRAAVIGSDADRHRFDYARLQRHRGGLLGSKRLQTYGSGDIWQHMVLDFWVSTRREQVAAAVSAGYCQRTTAYSSTRHCFDHPGNFFAVPFQPVIDDRAAAIYLAAFDGHREIFLLGYTNDAEGISNKMISDVAMVIQTYNDSQFWLVGVEANMPAAWRACTNVDVMQHRRFISYCDI